MEIDTEDHETMLKNFAATLPNAAGWRAPPRRQIALC